MNVVSVSDFYGCKAIEKQDNREWKSIVKPPWVEESRKMPSYILGPREFWREFDRQADALETAIKESKESDVLCTFVYQGDNGHRKFIVAHPERFWWHYEHRPPEKRCSYEVIPENYPCRLYLDLEYLVELNRESDGPSMTGTIIDVFSAYLLVHWGLPCNRHNVLDLDSSTGQKFSRHVIFNVRGVAFKNNYHVGRLVKTVCNDILAYLSSNGYNQHPIFDCFDRKRLERLLVETNRGKRLFIDTAVYTRNRHFRLYKSTKWGKGSNLVISNECKYIPSNVYNDTELSIFFDSLISYFGTKKHLILLECPENNDAVAAKSFEKNTQPAKYLEYHDACSKYPTLDRYIRNSITPGKIRACKYFESTKVLIYEMSGHRYCENIGRPHKSNNVFWVVDLKDKILYQKCHDQDCLGFKSQPKRLPEEICFQIDEEDDMLLSCAIATEDIVQELDPVRVECIYSGRSSCNRTVLEGDGTQMGAKF